MILETLISLAGAIIVFLAIAIPVILILAPTLFFFILAVVILASMGMVVQGLGLSIGLAIIAGIVLVIIQHRTGVNLMR